MSQLLSPERVRAVLGDSPLIDAEFVADMVKSANSDAKEGAEWLPYYKVALGVLARAFGELETVALFGIRAAATDDDLSVGRFAVIREQLDHARWLFKVHLRPIGIGPDESPERAAQVDASIEEELS